MDSYMVVWPKGMLQLHLVVTAGMSLAIHRWAKLPSKWPVTGSTVMALKLCVYVTW